jgi:mono/diheme cytochrome c family protein
VTRRVEAGVIALLALAAASSGNAAPVSAGAKLFQDNCQICHQADGVGVPGQFPRLGGRAPTIAASPEGRKFLSLIVLNGMSGSVSVDGQTIVGIMPGFPSLSDADLAAALTYVTNLGAGAVKPAPLKPAEIAAARAGGVQSPNAVVTLRNDLFGRKIIP